MTEAVMALKKLLWFHDEVIQGSVLMRFSWKSEISSAQAEVWTGGVQEAW